MGLDISAYKNVKLSDSQTDDNWEIYSNDDFPVQTGELAGKFYDEDVEADVDFRAGSYGGYNIWRNRLCELSNGISAAELWNDLEGANPDFYSKYKFSYLINFSDCEGYICSEICAILAKEFEDNISMIVDEDSYFKERYHNWLEAFKIGAQDGFVQFH